MAAEFNAPMLQHSGGGIPISAGYVLRILGRAHSELF